MSKIDYDYEVERKNMSDRIAGVISEEENELNMLKIDYHIVMHYIQEVSRILNSLIIHRRSVLRNHRKKTRQPKYDWYHQHGKVISQSITGTKKMMTQRRCSPNITCTSGEGRNVIHQSTGRT